MLQLRSGVSTTLLQGASRAGGRVGGRRYASGRQACAHTTGEAPHQKQLLHRCCPALPCPAATRRAAPLPRVGQLAQQPNVLGAAQVTCDRGGAAPLPRTPQGALQEGQRAGQRHLHMGPWQRGGGGRGRGGRQGEDSCQGSTGSRLLRSDRAAKPGQARHGTAPTSPGSRPSACSGWMASRLRLSRRATSPHTAWSGACCTGLKAPLASSSSSSTCSAGRHAGRRRWSDLLALIAAHLVAERNT